MRLAALFVVYFTLVAALVVPAPILYDSDSYYHLAVARLYATDGVTAKNIVTSRSRCVWGARFLAPDIEGLRPDVAVVRGCELMSAGMEVTVNEGMGREKVLGMPGRFEPLHLSLSSSCRSM